MLHQYIRHSGYREYHIKIYIESSSGIVEVKCCDTVMYENRTGEE